jgi:uncharacterized RDD family membrane protein YckC
MNEPQAAYCAKCGAPQPSAAASTTPSAGTPVVAAGATGYAPAYVAPTTAAVGYGGFWIRFVAIIIDAIIVSIATLPLRFLIVGSIFTTGFPLHGNVDIAEMGPLFAAGGKIFLLERVAWWLYDALMTASSQQGTVGKMAFGLKVTDLQGQRISFARATGRHFAKYISFFICFVGFIMAGFTARKQALHDMIAGTYVIKTSPAARVATTS